MESVSTVITTLSRPSSKCFGELDRRNQIGRAGNPAQRQTRYECLWHPRGCEVFLAGRLIEEPNGRNRRLVIDGEHHVGVLHVVNPRYVLVANALDAMLAKAVSKQRGALGGFAGGDAAAREVLLQVIARCNRAGGARGHHQARQAALRSKFALEDLRHGAAGDFVMPQVVAELVELIKDRERLTRIAQLPTLVEDLFDVALAAWSLDHFAGNLLQPGEALFAHPLRQDRD